MDIVARAYSAYGKALHRYLMRRLADSQRARELAQETYLRLLRVSEPELIRYPQAYLFRIASNLVTEWKTGEHRSPVTFNSRLVGQSRDQVRDPAALDPSEALALRQKLEVTLCALPPLHAAILLLRKRDGLSLKEIAIELNLSVHTVKKYLAHAVATCRERLLFAAFLIIAAACTPEPAPIEPQCELDQPRILIEGKAHCIRRDTP
jgi:RNA polymerase sigma factor (sigma-70 family)